MIIVRGFNQWILAKKRQQSGNQLSQHHSFFRIPPALLMSALLIVCLSTCITAGWSPANAQSSGGSLYDLKFEIINGTTGQPGLVDRLNIQLFTATGGQILDLEPEGSEFILPRVPVIESYPYLLTVWRHDIPYFWQFRGNKLTDNVQKLHVFDVSEDLTDIQIEGLTVMFKQRGSVADVEYMFNVRNNARPQVTVIGNPSTMTIAVPSGTTNLKAEYVRGPDPTPCTIHQLGGGKIGLEIPLVTGPNQFTVKGTLPWNNETTVPIDINLDVKNWSLMVSPESLEVQAFELVEDRDGSFPGFQRHKGPELEADRGFNVRIAHVGAVETTEDLFTQESTTEDEVIQEIKEEASEGSSPLRYFFLAITAILVGILIARARSNTKR